MNANAALKSYTNVHYEGQVAGASPQRLIQMLYEGVLERIAQAKGAMQQKNFELKGKKVSDAINIVMALRDSLNFEQGGEIAYNLDALYDYIARTLWQAHAKNNLKQLDEVSGLIDEVYSAWKQLA